MHNRSQAIAALLKCVDKYATCNAIEITQGSLGSAFPKTTSILAAKISGELALWGEAPSTKCSYRCVSADLAIQIRDEKVTEHACICRGDSVDSVAFEVIID